MGLYESLKRRKESGEKLNLIEMTSSQLKRMFIDELISDRSIAELFDVKPSKITYRRRKAGINLFSSNLDGFLRGATEKSLALNEQCKADILKKDNLDRIARAVTHFAFRNGPVEDMHADPDSQLSDEDMKILNTFMMNRMAYVFELIIEERWIEFSEMISSSGLYRQDWDKAIPDDGGTREEIEMKLKNLKYEVSK